MKALSYAGISQSDGSRCENLLLMCMDFRFHRRATDVLGFAGYRDMDLLAMPGGSKSLIDPDSREVILEAIQTAISAHGIKRLIILDHIDCKAYGGSEAFQGAQHEMDFHRKKLGQAADIVNSRFPGLEVVKLYLAWDYLHVVDGE